jgi:hypothetical protein
LSIRLDPPEILLRAGNSILQEAKQAGLLIGMIGLTPKAGLVSQELSKRSDRSHLNRQKAE